MITAAPVNTAASRFVNLLLTSKVNPVKSTSAGVSKDKPADKAQNMADARLTTITLPLRQSAVQQLLIFAQQNESATSAMGSTAMLKRRKLARDMGGPERTNGACSDYARRERSCCASRSEWPAMTRPPEPPARRWRR